MEDSFENFELNEEGRPYNIRHRCFFFSRDVLSFVKEAKYEKVYSSLFDQLVRSATSIGANVVEGRAGSTRKEWRKYFSIALKSANETKYWLCLIRDTMEDINKDTLKELIKEADELSKIIASILISAEG